MKKLVRELNVEECALVSGGDGIMTIGSGNRTDGSEDTSTSSSDPDRSGGVTTSGG